MTVFHYYYHYPDFLFLEVRGKVSGQQSALVLTEDTAEEVRNVTSQQPRQKHGFQDFESLLYVQEITAVSNTRWRTKSRPTRAPRRSR